MKIVRQGVPRGERLLHGRCNQCGCVVECKASEVMHDPDPREKGDPYVACPTPGCGNGYLWLTQGRADIHGDSSPI